MENAVKRETSCTENMIGNINGGGGKYPGTHKHSQTISKMKPKIRIIHIFAPEIIHTDVHNFRQLVQSLTGKHTGRQNSAKNTKQATHTSQESRRDSVNGCGLRDQTMKIELTNGVMGLGHQSKERLIKEEEQQQGFYDGEISSGGYLIGLEGFISEFGHFPFSPNWDASHRHTQEFEGALLS